MGDSELLTVDFDSFSKGMSFYSPEHAEKGFRVSASYQQLDHSGASTDTGEKLYSSPDLTATEQMDKLSSKTSLEKNKVADVGEAKLELQNGVHGGKENGSGDVGVESLMTSLGQLALGQSGVMNTRHTGCWDEQTLSSAMFHLLAQSGRGNPEGVAGQQRVGTTAGNISLHSPHQFAVSSVPLAVQQGSAARANLEPYQLLNNSGVPVQGQWARQNVQCNGSWLPNQHRPSAYVPANLLKPRQNSPFPKSLQHLVATNKTSSDLQSCDNAVRSANFQQVLYVYNGFSNRLLA